MPEHLRDYRNKIDEIDGKIIRLLKEREHIVKEIALCKVKENLPVHQPEREEEIYNRPDDEYIKNIYKIILEESRRLQNIIVSGE